MSVSQPDNRHDCFGLKQSAVDAKDPAQHYMSLNDRYTIGSDDEAKHRYTGRPQSCKDADRYFTLFIATLMLCACLIGSIVGFLIGIGGL